MTAFQQKNFAPTAQLVATLAMAIILTAAIACGGSPPALQSENPAATATREPTPTKAPIGGAARTSGSPPAPQSENPTATATREPTPTKAPIGGATWILESIDGRPPVEETYLTLTVNGPQFGGFDGCNAFGGRHESGKPVIETNGTISLPGFASTAAGCPTAAILDQAKRYLDALIQPAKARVVDDRLHIIDSSGEAALVFARQLPLAGQPVDLVGTGWKLVDADATYGEGPTTLWFLDRRAAIGTTSCRDYTVGYAASNGRMRMPYKGMSGSVEPCSRDAIDREHRFVEDFGWANEYSIHRLDGSDQLVVRTSRGKTLTFEPLPQPPGAIFEGRWRLTRFLETRSDSSGMRWPRKTDVAPDEAITAAFNEGAIRGSLGCHSYAYGAVDDHEATLIGRDGSIFLKDALLSTENLCDDRAPISPKQRKYLDFMGAAERYHVFGDRLVVLTGSGDALVFRPEHDTAGN